jgi:hypothetical protein
MPSSTGSTVVFQDSDLATDGTSGERNVSWIESEQNVDCLVGRLPNFSPLSIEYGIFCFVVYSCACLYLRLECDVMSSSATAMTKR